MIDAGMVELHLKPEALARYGLPDIGYPLRIDQLQKDFAEGGALDLPQLLSGLQNKSSEGQADWRSLEPALARLAELIAPDEQREVILRLAKSGGSSSALSISMDGSLPFNARLS